MKKYSNITKCLDCPYRTQIHIGVDFKVLCSKTKRELHETNYAIPSFCPFLNRSL